MCVRRACGDVSSRPRPEEGGGGGRRAAGPDYARQEVFSAPAGGVHDLLVPVPAGRGSVRATPGTRLRCGGRSCGAALDRRV